MESRPQPVEHLASLDAAAQALIRTADTSFVASGAHLELAQGGVDISHRGGRPGFIHLEGDRLWMPDFRGNRYMNTLGNLLAEPRAALLFIDFDRGDVLHLQGKRRSSGRRKDPGVEGAERYWRFDVHRAWRFAAALPWRGRDLEYSPATLATGVWHR